MFQANLLKLYEDREYTMTVTIVYSKNERDQFLEDPGV